MRIRIQNSRPLRHAGALLCCLASVLLAVSCGRTEPATGVLFIGNSYTRINGGLDQQLKTLAPEIRTASIVVDGSTLERHWTNGAALAEIRKGGWNYVVLQEQSQGPIANRKLWREFAAKFDEEIRKQGGKTVLLMTWERPDSVKFGVTTTNMVAAFRELGRDLHAIVAPAGVAFADSLRQKPGIVLNQPDGHPTQAGSYLAACILYKTILGRNPVGNPARPPGLDAATALWLQQVAEKTD
ncbi:MAG: hypothetical protein U1F98_10450 [Verrucomicrobiota bacterium]